MSRRIRPKTNPPPPVAQPQRPCITDDPEGEARFQLYERAKSVWGEPGFTVWADAIQEAAIQLLVEASEELDDAYQAQEHW